MPVAIIGLIVRRTWQQIHQLVAAHPLSRIGLGKSFSHDTAKSAPCQAIQQMFLGICLSRTQTLATAVALVEAS
jgi:hypothetical protein